MTNIVANGNAYSDDGSSSRDMQGGGFRQWLLPMLRDTMLQTDSGASAASQAQGIAVLASESAEASAQEAADALALVLATGSGWIPVLKIAVDGTRYVLQVADWTGGRGTKPAVGYMAATGVVPTVAGGLNIRGAVAYADLTGKPTLGTAAALNVPAAPATAATAAQVVRGDDPRLAGGSAKGTQLYTTSQSIPKSTFGTASYVFVELWGGGGSGQAVCTTNSAQNAPGGEGGEYASALIYVSSLSTSTALVIGSGGASVTATSTTPVAGNNGGDSSFAGLTALGGLGAAASGTGPAKNWLAGKTGGEGGGETLSDSPTSIVRATSGPGGSSVMGGGGGGGGGDQVAYSPAGTSQFTGNGGTGVFSAVSPLTGNNGGIPSGGGSGTRLNLSSGKATSGAGARGQARLTWW